MGNKNNIIGKILVFLKNNGRKIIITLFFLSVIATFIFCLGFATYYWPSKESGYILSSVRIGSKNYPDLAGSQYSDCTSFYTPMQEFNRFVLITSVLSIFFVAISLIVGNRRRKKYYVSNFITGFISSFFALIIAIFSITQISYIQNLWNEQVSYDRLYNIQTGEPMYEETIFQKVDLEGQTRYQLGFREIVFGVEFSQFTPATTTINVLNPETGLYASQIVYVYIDDISEEAVLELDSGDSTIEYYVFSKTTSTSSISKYYYSYILREGLVDELLVTGEVVASSLPRKVNNDSDLAPLRYMLVEDDEIGTIYAVQSLSMNYFTYDYEYPAGSGILLTRRDTVQQSTILETNPDHIYSDWVNNFGYASYTAVIITSASYVSYLLIKMIAQVSKYNKKVKEAENYE